MTRNAALAVCCALSLPTLPLAAEVCPGTSFGAGVTLEETASAADILADPQSWDARAVRVEGEVRDVCAMAGCWLAIAVGEGDQTLRVKVKDGEIVFPLSARGHRAIAQGVVEVRELSAEDAQAFDRHLAEERGETPEEEGATAAPRRLVQVRGTGAVVCEGP